MAELDKISSPSRPGYGGGATIEARFAHFCKNDLKLDDDNLLALATKLLDESKHLLLANVSALGTGSLEEAERYWFAFVLYSVRRLNENGGNVEKGLSLCQILRAAKLNIDDFYRELYQFLIKAGSILSNLYGVDWEKRLEAKESHTDFVYLFFLSRTYRSAYRDLFSLVNANDDKHLNMATTSGCGSDYYRFGWLLFLALHVRVPPLQDPGVMYSWLILCFGQ